MNEEIGKLLRKYIELQKQSTLVLEALYAASFGKQGEEPDAEDDQQDQGHESPKLYHVLLSGQQITHNQVRQTNVLDAIIEHEAPKVDFGSLVEKWNRQTVQQTGYGPVIDAVGYEAVPDKVKYKYQPNRSRTADGKKVYVLKQWAMVRDKVTNTPGNFQHLLQTMQRYGYTLTPPPQIPTVIV